MLVHAVVAPSGKLLFSDDMERPLVGGLAPGWVNTCYGANGARFAQETREGHGGNSAQRE